MNVLILIVTLLGAVFMTGAVGAGEETRLPGDLPPIIAMAVAREADEPAALQPGQKQLEITLTCPQLRWEVAGKTKSKREWPKTLVKMEKCRKTLRFDTLSQLVDSRVVGMDGKDLDRADILKRLARETPVLVSVTGNMVESYYLQLTKPDAIIVILGPRDGEPAPELLPAPKSEP